MAEVLPLPQAGSLVIPLAGGATLRLTPFRQSPYVALALHGPDGGDAGGVMLHAERARVLASWLVKLADECGTPVEQLPPRPTAVTAGPSRHEPAVPPTVLDPRATLAGFTRLTIPSFADWCSIDVVENHGTVHRMHVAHADPACADVARTIQRYPPTLRQRHPRSGVFRTGEPDIAPVVTERRLVAAAHDEVHLAALRAAGCRSSLCVPLIARGRILGVMTFATSDAARRYGTRDLPLALGLARCAALVVDNARLYRVARTALAPLRLAAGGHPSSRP